MREKKMKVWVLSVFEEGSEPFIQAFATHQGAWSGLLAFVVEHWDNEALGDFGALDDAETTDPIDLFFKESESYWSISGLEVRGQDPGGEARLTPGMCAALRFAITNVPLVQVARELQRAGEPVPTVGHVERTIKEIERQLS